MFNWFAYFFVMFPFYCFWKAGAISGKWCILWMIAVTVVCFVQTATRHPRIPIYGIFTRMVLTVWVPGLLVWWVLISEATDMSFYEWSLGSYAGIAFFVITGYVFVTGGFMMAGEAGNVKAAGYHPYWDSLPAMWNPHGWNGSSPDVSVGAPSSGSSGPSKPSGPSSGGPYMPVQ